MFGEYALSLLGNTQSQKQDFTAYNAGINFIFTKASVGGTLRESRPRLQDFRGLLFCKRYGEYHPKQFVEFI